jgi:hypothetical protein
VLAKPPSALPIESAYSLLSPTEAPVLDQPRWVDLARIHLGARVTFPDLPADHVLDERAEFDLVIADASSSDGPRVRVVTVPIGDAGHIVTAARDAVAAIGGAGMDVLVARAKRVWQIDARDAARVGDRSLLLAATVAAMVLLAPIVPPTGDAIFGVKTARERLAREETSR